MFCEIFWSIDARCSVINTAAIKQIALQLIFNTVSDNFLYG